MVSSERRVIYETATRISVCIANYNGERVLADCIDSVLAQTFDESVEIIVHDDASTDTSLRLIADRYAQVRLIASETNVGFCIANNRMVEQARGEFVLLLNNDAALAPDALSTLLAEARGLHSQGILTLPQFDWESDALVDRGCLLDPFCNPVPNHDPQRREVATVIGACLWLPRALWQQLGGFPPWFGSIAEDMALCCGARLLGCPVRVTAASRYRHRQGASFGGNRVGSAGMQTTTRRRALSERNKTAVMLICYPLPALLVLLPLHALALLAEVVFLLLSGTGSVKVRAIYVPILPWLWQHRRDIAALRRQLRAAGRIGTLQFFSQTTWLPHKLRMLWRYGQPQIG